MSIEVKEVSKRYGEQLALNNVSFNIASGEVVGFLGPNGAGKSTMMKIITGYIPPTSGTASVCGHDVMEDSKAARRNVGYLPEHNPLYLDMYVKEYLRFVAGMYKVKNARERTDEMIELVGLTLEQKKPIGALSKGYRQRVGLAQAMIHDPAVLILDEPTSGLDPNQLSEIRSLIRTIGEKKTVMLSTHIMQEVEAICDRVIIINRGNIVADSPVNVLMSNVTRMKVLVVEFNALTSSGDLKKLKGVQRVEHVDGFQYRISHAPELDLREDLFQFAVQHKLSVLGMQAEHQKLEDIFKQLTHVEQTN
ncbi:MAG: gliding motility-associated ABC transporter ATP-binding subunit GldA [Cryomorphaceae bacterium]|nr:MAG: gliding motility-associated ABC transporter ATP-binding subunit GldA [Cryomorphaceae bacterium]